MKRYVNAGLTYKWDISLPKNPRILSGSFKDNAVGTAENTEIEAAINSDDSWTLTADGGVLAVCPAVPVVDTNVTAVCDATALAPNMWDLTWDAGLAQHVVVHPIYTVYTLPGDSFPLTCVDAEFPHFPYSHYVEFSTLPPSVKYCPVKYCLEC